MALAQGMHNPSQYFLSKIDKLSKKKLVTGITPWIIIWSTGLVVTFYTTIASSNLFHQFHPKTYPRTKFM